MPEMEPRTNNTAPASPCGAGVAPAPQPRVPIAAGQLTRLTALQKGLIESGFYGTLEVRFEAGHVVCLRKSETLKI